MRLMILACLLAIGCQDVDVRMGSSTYGYQTGEPDWQAQKPTLNRPRAAHSVVALGSGDFLVLGGDSDVDRTSANSPIGELELNLDVERCTPSESRCQVVARLPRGVERAQAVMSPDGAIVISDGHSLLILDLQTGSTVEMPIQARQLVATDAGIAVLGIAGDKDPETNLPGPWEFGVIRNAVGGVEMIAAPPNDVSVQVTASLGGDRVFLASKAGSAILDVATGLWTAAPASPVARDSVGVLVGDAAVLVRSYGEQFAYIFLDSTQEWVPVAVPSTSAIVLRAIPTRDGAVFIVSDKGNVSTQSFRYSDSTWIAGPGSPPWSALNATTVLDNDLVISVGGANYDFIAARAAN